MPSLKAVQVVVPSAFTAVGRVVAFHEGKHVDLGEFVGGDAVALNKLGDSLMEAAAKKVEDEKEAVAQEAKAKAKEPKGKPKPKADFDLNDELDIGNL